MQQSIREDSGTGRRTRPRRSALGALTSMLVIAAMLPVALVALSGVASAAPVCTATPITINDRVSAQPPNSATPYPSPLVVSGQVGTISDVNVTFNDVTEARTDDLDILLVAPGGTNLLAISDTGGLNAATNVDITLDDAAATGLPDSTAWSSGTFKPTDFDATADEAFPAPAPSPSANTTLAAFNGLNPNGTWNLYVVDDSLGGGAGSIASWCLDITTNAAAQPTATAVTSDNNPSFTGDAVTFTATVTSSAVPVPTGTVTFTVDGVTAASNVPVDANGQATFTTSSLTEGSHTIQATYNGTATFATSSGSMTQVVNNHTTVSGNSFCNPGQITINSAAQANQPATPYPSNVFVTGLSGTLTDVNLTLKGVNHTNPDDIDILLVGPGGQNLIALSDAGGSTAVANFTVTFDDAAASPLPDTGGWGVSPATAQVSSYAPADSFPAPAPAPSAATTLATFNGTAPNGTWALYVVDDALGTGGSIANGWCLDFTTGGTQDLSVSLAHTPEPVVINELITQTLGLSNVGTGAATTVHLSETLPTSWVFVSLTQTSGPPATSCSTPAAGATGTVSCDWTSFAAGASASFTLKVRPKQTGSFTPTASVTQDPGDSVPGNDSDDDPTTVVPNGRGCTLVGTSGADTLNGTDGPDVICGLGGADHLNGLAGADSLFGQAGGDTLTDTSGTDHLLGGPGDDSLNTQDGSGGDVDKGGTGTNTCTTDPGDTRQHCS